MQSAAARAVDLVVFPAIADHLTTAGKEHEIRGAVPLFDHVQSLVDLAAPRFRMQIPTAKDCFDGLAQFGDGLVGWVLHVLSGESPQDGFRFSRPYC